MWKGGGITINIHFMNAKANTNINFIKEGRRKWD